MPRLGQPLALGSYGRRSGRQTHVDDRAAAELARHPELALVGDDQVLDDGEAEAGTALLACAARIDPVKSFEQAWQVLARDAGAVVGHLQLELPVDGARAHRNRT